MKIKKIILLIFLLSTFSFAYGQCKYAKKNSIKVVNKQLTTEIQKMSRLKIIFKKFSNMSQAGFFINENQEYFFALALVRSFSSKFEILEDQKLIINFENNIDLTLNSGFNVESKMPGLAFDSQFVWAAYKIDKEQIKIFTENPLFNLKIYFVSEKEISNTFSDEDGTYFEFEVLSDKFKSNLIKPAGCILQVE